MGDSGRIARGYRMDPSSGARTTNLWLSTANTLMLDNRKHRDPAVGNGFLANSHQIPARARQIRAFFSFGGSTATHSIAYPWFPRYFFHEKEARVDTMISCEAAHAVTESPRCWHGSGFEKSPAWHARRVPGTPTTSLPRRLSLPAIEDSVSCKLRC